MVTTAQTMRPAVLARDLGEEVSVDPHHGATPWAFEAVVEQFAPMAYNIALRILRHPADAEDAVQDAFVSAY